jgi:autophagy-related protein 17
MLDALGAQAVPPDFHAPLHDGEDVFVTGDADAPPDAAARRARRADRARWKTLRDFVDERGVGDALERMDGDRAALGDLLLGTAAYPAALSAAATRAARPPAQEGDAPALVRDVLASQERASAGMAALLESLGEHFEQIAGALRDAEGGEPFGADDVLGACAALGGVRALTRGTQR